MVVKVLLPILVVGHFCLFLHIEYRHFSEISPSSKEYEVVDGRGGGYFGESVNVQCSPFFTPHPTPKSGRPTNSQTDRLTHRWTWTIKRHPQNGLSGEFHSTRWVHPAQIIIKLIGYQIFLLLVLLSPDVLGETHIK